MASSVEGWQPETQPVKHRDACRLTWVHCCRFYTCVQCDCMILYCDLFFYLYNVYIYIHICVIFIYIYINIHIYLLCIARVYMSSFANAFLVFLSLSLMSLTDD